MDADDDGTTVADETLSKRQHSRSDGFFKTERSSAVIRDHPRPFSVIRGSSSSSPQARASIAKRAVRGFERAHPFARTFQRH
jgi:hypothetical protein